MRTIELIRHFEMTAGTAAVAIVTLPIEDIEDDVFDTSPQINTVNVQIADYESRKPFHYVTAVDCRRAKQCAAEAAVHWAEDNDALLPTDDLMPVAA